MAAVGDELDAVAAAAAAVHQVATSTPGRRARSGCRRRTLLAVLDDIGRCVAMTPAQRLVFLNGHGGNSALLDVANRELRLNHGLMTFLTHPGMPADQGGASPADELGMGVHGGTDETSMMLHLAPAPRRHGRRPSGASPRSSPTTATCASAAGSASAGCPTTSSPTATSAIPRRPPPSAATSCSRARCARVRATALREIATFDFGR